MTFHLALSIAVEAANVVGWLRGSIFMYW